ncbi:MAG: hypothetical protein ACE5FR_03400 [Rhodospirillales bacterium]
MRAELHEAFFRRGWRLAHLGPDGAYVWDTSRESITRVDPAMLERLTRDHIRDAQPEQASQDRTELTGEQPVVPLLGLDLLDTTILVRCRHAACREGIRAHFGPHCRDELWRTPDFVVECDLPEADHDLFRVRPPEESDRPLEGIRVRCFGAAAVEDWTFAYPPLPPFSLAPLKDRFVGLHAACVRTAEGAGILLLGDAGSGKTTLSTRLVNEFGGSLLTDELVCLYRRSCLVAPFAIAMGVVREAEDGRLAKVRVAADTVVDAVADGPVSVTHCVFLSRKPGSPPTVEPIRPGAVLRGFVTHHFDIGTESEETLVTLAGLAMRTSCAELTYGTYADLQRSAESIVAFAGANERS